jgi:hypothetical protein
MAACCKMEVFWLGVRGLVTVHSPPSFSSISLPQCSLSRGGGVTRLYSCQEQSTGAAELEAFLFWRYWGLNSGLCIGSEFKPHYLPKKMPQALVSQFHTAPLSDYIKGWVTSKVGYENVPVPQESQKYL